MAVLIQYANGVPAVKFSLEELQTCIGRGLDSDICVADKFVSKQHAVIEAKPGKSEQRQQEFVLRDLGSTNHTYVNDLLISEVLLKHGDIIRLGEEEFVFECSAEQQQDFAVEDSFPAQDDTVERLNVDMEQASDPAKKFSRRLRVF